MRSSKSVFLKVPGGRGVALDERLGRLNMLIFHARGPDDVPDRCRRAVDEAAFVALSALEDALCSSGVYCRFLRRS